MAVPEKLVRTETCVPTPGRLVRLGDGRLVTIRPIRPEDEDRDHEFLDHLSPESRYQRYFGLMGHLDPAIIDRLARADFDQSLALVATVTDAEGERQVAIASYAILPGGRTAEFAIAVDDAWQEQGLGQELLGSLIAAARDAHRLKRLEGVTMADNHRMLRLARRAGFSLRRDSGDARVVKMEQAL